jgi:N-acetylornithine carbamoyltransferase
MPRGPRSGRCGVDVGPRGGYLWAMTPSERPQHLIRLDDLQRGQVEDLLDLSARLKRRAKGPATELAGRTAGLLFFRGSLRTRTSFEAAMNQLGGQVIHLTAASDFWELEEREGAVMDGRAPEHIKDAAAVLSCYVDVLAIRPKPAGASWDTDRRDAEIRAWAEHAHVPVINMESCLWHPLQTLADLLTMREALGELRGRRLAIVWTRSPTPASPAPVHSLLHAALRFGVNVAIAHPPGYELDAGVMAEAAELAREGGAELSVGLGLAEGVEGADVVYGRSWQSLEDYGNPTLTATRRARAPEWTVDERLLTRGRQAHFMHAMPVRRNLEVTDEVLDGPRSLVYQQAENRLHSQKALLSMLLR